MTHAEVVHQTGLKKGLSYIPLILKSELFKKIVFGKDEPYNAKQELIKVNRESAKDRIKIRSKNSSYEVVQKIGIEVPNNCQAVLVHESTGLSVEIRKNL